MKFRQTLYTAFVTLLCIVPTFCQVEQTRAEYQKALSYCSVSYSMLELPVKSQYQLNFTITAPPNITNWYITYSTNLAVTLEQTRPENWGDVSELAEFDIDGTPTGVKDVQIEGLIELTYKNTTVVSVLGNLGELDISKAEVSKLKIYCERDNEFW